MKRPINKRKPSPRVAVQYQGERIETKIARMVEDKEPISDTAPIMYTERKDGVLPDYDIRTDKWEFAVEGMDKVHRADIAKRGVIKDLKGKKVDEGNEDGGAKSIDGTTDN